MGTASNFFGRYRVAYRSSWNAASVSGFRANTTHVDCDLPGGSQVTVETEFCENLPPALVDANKIKQVFVNALTNAAHAMPEGGALTVRTYIKKLTPEEAKPSPGARQTHEFRAGERVLVTEIDDDGTGVAEDKLGRVFEPFYTTKAAGKGTGLGLTVSRKIVELHEGTIQIQNRTPRGARVTITLRTERS